MSGQQNAMICHGCICESECPSMSFSCCCQGAQSQKNNIAVERSSDLPKSSIHQPFCSAASQLPLYQQLRLEEQSSNNVQLQVLVGHIMQLMRTVSCIGNGMKRCGPLQLWNLFTKLGLPQLPRPCGDNEAHHGTPVRVCHSTIKIYQRIEVFALARFSI